jgi:two-component system, OmpR family, response regulator
LAERMTEVMRGAGFVIDRAADGETGWSLGEAATYDAAVLDLGLPRMSGVEILKRWRGAGLQHMVLVLSARGSWSERVEVLNAGADDYVTKPINPCEVVARIHALLRRSTRGGAVLSDGDVIVDPTAGSVIVAGATVDVTARELQILTYLMYRKGRIVSQAELIEHVYTENAAPEANTIQVHVARLRKKLGRETIRTLRGLGYKVG